MPSAASKPFDFLLAGHDTVECAYYLQLVDRSKGFDFERLACEREALRACKDRNPKPLQLGSAEFMLLPNGSASGYPFIIANNDFTISFGEFNNPSFYVKFRSEALWRDGAFTLHQKFLTWAEGLGFVMRQPEGLSRVDFTFDYLIPELDFDEESMVSLSTKEAQFRESRKLQTLQYGKGDIVLRIYDKSAEIEQSSQKYWFEQLWGCFDHVWRIEWQIRKTLLKRFGIRTFRDLQDQQGDLLRYLAHEHDTLRIKSEDSNRSRWPTHPLWADLAERIAALNQIGMVREIDEAAVLSERLTRISIALYGYLKRIAAIHALQTGSSFVSNHEALKRTESLIARVHDPMTWRIDVEKRIDVMRLGQW